jgi:predicted glycosyltransferase
VVDDGEGRLPVGERIIFYSHNGFGLGHVRRNFLLARALRDSLPGADILLITGSPFPQDPALLEGIDYVRLPSFLRIGRDEWSPKQLRGASAYELARLRSDIIEAVVRRFRPNLLVADHLPQGVDGELIPGLEALRSCGGRAVAGFRDILDTPDSIRATWKANRTPQVLRDHYTRALIYGDPEVFDFREYDLPGDVARMVIYCGYLGRPSFPADVVRDASFRLRAGYDRALLACAGGGADGSCMLRAVVAAGPDLQDALRARMVVVSGPLMGPTERRGLDALAERLHVEVRERIEAFSLHVAACDLLIGMCGYNTACEALSYRVPFLAVPREIPSAEQLMRARAFARLGLLTTIEQDRLDPSSLVVVTSESLARGGPTQIPFPMDGVDRARDVLLDLM